MSNFVGTTTRATCRQTELDPGEGRSRGAAIQGRLDLCGSAESPLPILTLPSEKHRTGVAPCRARSPRAVWSSC
jgi:hypothetical protein